MKLLLPFLALFTLILINANAQTVKNKKATYEGTFCYIERENAELFNYEDNDIKFTIRPDSWSWNIQIENKTNQNMTILWDEALFVVNQQSAGFMSYSNHFNLLSYLISEEVIAQHSYIKKECTNTTLRGGFIVDNRIIKKTGEDYYIRLVFPIEVNGKLKKYEFKYRVYLINAKKQQKYKEKRLKKIKKQLEKVIKENSSH